METARFVKENRYRLVNRSLNMDGIYIFCKICPGAGKRYHYLFRHELAGYRITFTDLSINDPAMAIFAL